MSLTDWVRWDSELLDTLYEKPTLDIEGELKATPLTKNYATVGTAFDYAMRIKLLMFNRGLLSSNSQGFKMVAETGVALFPNKRRKLFIQDFKERLSSMLRNGLEYNTLLPDCIILAKLDSLYRTGKNFPDSINFEVNKDDIEDLINLTSLISSEQWIAKEQCLLNPTFGQSSLDVGGADADIIIDNILVDIKTTKYLKFTREQFRQLMGYIVLNARQGERYKEMSYDIERVGIYFSRHGKLFTFPTQKFFSVDEVEDIDGNLFTPQEAIEDSIIAYQEA